MKLFSSLDLEYIHRSLGRKPSKKELGILHDIVEPVLVQRKKLPARFVNQIGLTQKNVHFEIRNVKPNGNWGSFNFLIRDCALRGSWPVQVSFIWLFSPTQACLKRIHDTETSLSQTFAPVITHHASKDAPRKKSGKVIAVAIMEDNPHPRKVGSGQWLGYVKIPKPGSTLMNEKRIMNVLSGYDRFVSGFSLQKNYGTDLRQLFNMVSDSASIELTFPRAYKKGDGILISEGVSDFELKNKLNDVGYDYQKVGKIKSDLYHVFDFGDGQSKKWPIGVTQISIHGKEDEPVVSENDKTFLKKKTAKKPTLMKVVKDMIAAEFPNNRSENLLDDGLGQKIRIGAKHIFQSSEHSLFDGSRSVANIVRKLAMEGANVESLTIISNVDDPGFLAGQQSVIHVFGLQGRTQTHFSHDLQPDHHQVIGIGGKNYQKEMLIQESDFISLLGSMKGELGHSLYQELTGINCGDNQPVFDSALEYNINQSLIQAVSTGVIKKVNTILKGGLATALMSLYLNLNCSYGMKIHISRKLTPEELLFGESFGSALVIVGEKELMEFQRICMLHGIPCSTIGRLQAKTELSVNDILKIPEKVLNTLST